MNIYLIIQLKSLYKIIKKLDKSLTSGSLSILITYNLNLTFPGHEMIHPKVDILQQSGITSTLYYDHMILNCCKNIIRTNLI